MKQYHVIWNIDLQAPDIYTAAEEARRVMEDPGCHAYQFTVKRAGRYYNVDLDEDGKAIVVYTKGEE